jgi:hypothetical protein
MSFPVSRAVRLVIACTTGAIGLVLLWRYPVPAIALLIMAPIIPALRTKRSTMIAATLALLLPALVIWILFPISLLARADPFELDWNFVPNSNAYRSVSISGKGTARRLGWTSRKSVWGYSVPVSSETVIVLLNNDGELVFCRVLMTDRGSPERKIVFADGLDQPFTLESLETWLKQNDIQLPNWSRHGELGDLYFAIHAATGGAKVQPNYHLLKNVTQPLAIDRNHLQVVHQ